MATLLPIWQELSVFVSKIAALSSPSDRRQESGLAGIVTVFEKSPGWQGWQPGSDITDKRRRGLLQTQSLIMKRVPRFVDATRRSGLAGIVTVFEKNPGWQGWQPGTDLTDKRRRGMCQAQSLISKRVP
jgi:hypothetical protein